MDMKIVPHLIDQTHLAIVAPGATVREVADVIVERKVSAVLVAENGRLLGIFSDRDIASRVVHEGRDPATTKVSEVMTRDPDTLPPDADIGMAMRMMIDHGYRHLPVMDGKRILGVVSDRDIYTSVVKNMQAGISDLARELLQG